MKKNFHEKFEIQVIDANKKWVRHAYPNSAWFSDSGDKDYVINHIESRTEPLITLTIPKSRLDELEKIHDIFFNNRETSADQRRMVEIIMEQRYAEQAVRKRVPGVQQAYEHYSTLLHLTGYSDKIDLG